MVSAGVGRGDFATGWAAQPLRMRWRNSWSGRGCELTIAHSTVLRSCRQEIASGTVFSRPVSFQRKKNGKLRVCVDYRALNHNTVKFAYPMPRIEQLLESLKDYTVVSKLDLAEGFHQIRMDPNDIPKTTFVTQFRAFEFLVMPFGLANAPAQFTLLMNTILKGLPFVVVFMDDILVFSRTVSEHHDHVREVLNRLRTHKLYASPKKCEFYRESVEYLGHVITPPGC